MNTIPLSRIKVLKPLATAVPAASARDDAALRADIERNGCIMPVLLDQDDVLLDGHRRLAAAKSLGLEELPFVRVTIDTDEGNQHAETAIVANAVRRQLSVHQRAAIGLEFLRVERRAAKKRQRDGQKKGRAQQLSDSDVAHGEPQPEGKKPRQAPLRATDVAALRAGVSRATLEKVERIKKASPALFRDLLAGKIGIPAALQKIKLAAARKRSKRAEQGTSLPSNGAVPDLHAVEVRYRTVLIDPPWPYRDSGVRGAAAHHYPTMTLNELATLPIKDLLEPTGAAVWVWTTFPLLREGAPQRLLEAWGLEWLGELVWDKTRLGTGHYVRSRLELLILAAPPAAKPTLLSDVIDPLVVEARTKHSAKPRASYKLLRQVSPAPRLELFARSRNEGFDAWGLEAPTGENEAPLLGSGETGESNS